MKQNTQNGNAIILILVAIALFAALGYAFSNSSRTSSSFLSDAEAEAYANQIIAYGNDVKSAVKRLQLRGCSDTEISFENNQSTTIGGYLNVTRNDCFVFDTQGGGLQFKQFSENMLSPNVSIYGRYEAFFTGNTSIKGVGSDCESSECNDLVLVKTHLKKSICEKINIALNNNQSPDHILEIDTNSIGVENFNASNLYKYEPDRNIFNSTTGELNGIKQGCVEGQINPGTGGYNYFQVLIAR